MSVYADLVRMPPPDWVAMWTGVAALAVVVMVVGAWLISLAPTPRRRSADDTPTLYLPRHDGRRTMHDQGPVGQPHDLLPTGSPSRPDEPPRHVDHIHVNPFTYRGRHR